MSKIEEFFLTDLEAMTRTDWAGVIIAVALAVLMIGLYVWVFRPKNRDRFEQYRDFVNKDDDMEREVKHGGQ